MKCREKLKIEHPEYVNNGFTGGCNGCPDWYKYLDMPDYCPKISNVLGSYAVCSACWDREIPEEKNEETASLSSTDQTFVDTLIAVRAELMNGGFTSSEAYNIILTSLSKSENNSNVYLERIRRTFRNNK